MAERMHLTKNKEKALKIIEAIYNKDGYCPCSILQNEDTICPCKEMIEKNECHCGLYEM